MKIIGVDMTIGNSTEIFERIQMVIEAYDCEHMKCDICKLNPICNKRNLDI